MNKQFNYLMNMYDINNYVYRTEIYGNADKYIGEFKNNKRNGKGIIIVKMMKKREKDMKENGKMEIGKEKELYIGMMVKDVKVIGKIKSRRKREIPLY